ncbi:MAG: cation transporter [Deltaproteobacteria bacterium]|nr:cation transporter [Deltaproteobacteria bacterium]
MTGHQKGLLAEYFTVGWNVLEGIIAIAAGVAAGSIALVGFGLDSYIEVASGVVLIWRLRKHGFSDEDEEEAAEKKAIFFVGLTFCLLALYVTYESGKKLLFQEYPDESLIGIILATVSLVVMPFLAFYKKKIAQEINSRALRADALETLACSYLSLTLVVGLLANAVFGWWWADPVAALAMVYFLVKEGWEAIEESRGRVEEETEFTD